MYAALAETAVGVSDLHSLVAEDHLNQTAEADSAELEK